MNKLWKSVNANRTNEKFEGCKLLIASQPWIRNPILCNSLKYDFYKDGASRRQNIKQCLNVMLRRSPPYQKAQDE